LGRLGRNIVGGGEEKNDLAVLTKKIARLGERSIQHYQWNERQELGGPKNERGKGTTSGAKKLAR